MKLLNEDIDHKILAPHFGKTNEAMRKLKRRYEQGLESLWVVYVKAYNHDIEHHIKGAGVINCNVIKKSEEEYKIDVITNFCKIFPKYRFIGKEVEVSDGGFIDILAETTQSKRKVIIELKLGNGNGRRQLRDYSFEFENPILINISEKEVKKKSLDILYITFKDLFDKGIKNDNCNK